MDKGEKMNNKPYEIIIMPLELEEARNVLRKLKEMKEMGDMEIPAPYICKTPKNIETDRCPFREKDILTGESSSYCMVGDCMFDPIDEDKCAIFTHLKKLIKEARA